MGLVAVLDIGTVTCRLGVAEVANGHVCRCTKTSTICNLGQGVAQTGELAPEAIERVVTCISSYLESASAAGASVACCTLTSAARDAKNSEALLDGLRSLGVVPQVIPGEIEGKLTFLGVAQDFADQRICVADNGGGSTEIAVGMLSADSQTLSDARNSSTALNLEAVKSLNVGCRRVTDLFLKREDPPSAQSTSEARAFCANAFAQELPEAARSLGEQTRLVCVGGTVTTLVAISAALDPYDPTFVHLHDLSLAEVDGLVERIAALLLEERRQLTGLQPKRAEVILGGAICVSELMRAAGVEHLTVSESDLLYGLSIVTDAANCAEASPIGWQPELFALR